MKVMVGLGNEGPRYVHTRHNVGFDVIAHVAARHSTRPWARGEACAWIEVQIDGRAVRLVRPSTFMNRSGEAWRDPALRAIAPPDTLLVCDDVNMPAGALRLRAGGGDGGHHGLASCLAALGTEDVPRLRIGVGCQALPKDLTDFVLSPFDAGERPLIADAMARAVEACELWVADGIEGAMNRVNARQQP